MNRGVFKPACSLCLAVVLLFALVGVRSAAWAEPHPYGDKEEQGQVNPPPSAAPCTLPDANDHTVVVDMRGGDGHTWDAFHRGTYTISVPVARYVGEVDPTTGYLVNWRTMVRDGMISKFASLEFWAFDVDSNTVPPNGPFPGGGPASLFPNEVDAVSWNGQPMAAVAGGNTSLLRGTHQTWTKYTYTIPIEKIRFPARGVAGTAPTPAYNELQIDVDMLGGPPTPLPAWEVWIDSVVLKFNVVSPIVFVHGNSSNGEFFERQGIFGYFSSLKWPCDKSVTFDPNQNARSLNAIQLRQQMNTIAQSYGCDTVHLIAHSKGGLDARDLLPRLPVSAAGATVPISLVTLGCPHNGSPLADIMVAAKGQAGAAAAKLGFSGFSGWEQFVITHRDANQGYFDLRVAPCAAFNARNIPALPSSMNYYAASGDMDLNASLTIDYQLLQLQEWTQLPEEDSLSHALLVDLGNLASPDAVAGVFDTVYQLLRSNPGITVTTAPIPGRGGEFVQFITAAPITPSQPNDILVPMDSGLGVGSFARRMSAPGLPRVGTSGANHSTIASPALGPSVKTWLLATERQRGGWK